MRHMFHAALVIARRDYVASVWSRSFFIFLISPMFPILFGVLFGTMGARMDADRTVPAIAVIVDAASVPQLQASHQQLMSALPVERRFSLVTALPERNVAAQAAALVTRPGTLGVISISPDAIQFRAGASQLARYGPAVDHMIADYRRQRSLEEAGAAGPMPRILHVKEAQAAATTTADRRDVARGGQLLLLVLTMVLAGMLISNMMEEKSSKVIEVLAAAAPVDAIFFGKLMAMLGMSLTGITVWASVAYAALHATAPQLFAAIPEPAVGWPLFGLLGLLYFVTSYLLLGALFLAIGAQAGTMREVQTLSMPLTIGQLIVFALASLVVDNPDAPVAFVAAAVPWSSPFAMIAQAALGPEIWIHLAALAWQGLWVAIMIRLGARFFRRSVLKSGPPLSPLGYLRRRLRG